MASEVRKEKKHGGTSLCACGCGVAHRHAQMKVIGENPKDGEKVCAWFASMRCVNKGIGGGSKPPNA